LIIYPLHHSPLSSSPPIPGMKKIWHICLFKIAKQGVSLWHFHVLYFYSFYLSPLLMVASTGLKILYSFLYRPSINHIHLLDFLLLVSPSHMWLCLSVTCINGSKLFFVCFCLCFVFVFDSTGIWTLSLAYDWV
jgi:hypothetical protein